MKRIQYIAIYGGLIIGLMGCKKEVADPDSSNPNVLPPLTHEGKNTFGCLVNGEVWVAYVSYAIGGSQSLENQYNNEDSSIHLKALREDDSGNLERIDIFVKNILNTGYYQVYTFDNELRGFTDYSGNYNCGLYNYNNELLRSVVVTYLSSSERIMSGTFEMDLINTSCPEDTIRIREGRFDCSY
ncbi:hypothetical protein GCM10009118_13420 [Wandonia haliotis]|uniref:Uncharacterized protein n=1 Tax=Wandonia haliotis TaxID=574963 RepID=A0ABN1MNR2_9FLAO